MANLLLLSAYERSFEEWQCSQTKCRIPFFVVASVEAQGLLYG